MSQWNPQFFLFAMLAVSCARSQPSMADGGLDDSNGASVTTERFREMVPAVIHRSRASSSRKRLLLAAVGATTVERQPLDSSCDDSECLFFAVTQDRWDVWEDRCYHGGLLECVDMVLLAPSKTLHGMDESRVRDAKSRDLLAAWSGKNWEVLFALTTAEKRAASAGGATRLEILRRSHAVANCLEKFAPANTRARVALVSACRNALQQFNEFAMGTESRGFRAVGLSIRARIHYHVAFQLLQVDPGLPYIGEALAVGDREFGEAVEAALLTDDEVAVWIYLAHLERRKLVQVLFAPRPTPNTID